MFPTRSHSLSPPAPPALYPRPFHHPLPRDQRIFYPHPAIISPALHPFGMDACTFYPYAPNEVKHRRRTTSAQLKILEGVFKTDTKPNAALRNKLAVELDMTSRGVQVWFQNRRAKEKLKASKNKSPKSQPDDVAKPTDEAEAKESSSPSADVPLASISTSASTEESAQASSIDPEQATAIGAEGEPQTVSPTTATSSEAPASTVVLASSQGNPDDSSLLLSRRGSLPTYPPASDDEMSTLPTVERTGNLGRRRSVDTSLHRLASNPYAMVAKARNSISAAPSRGLPYRPPGQRALSSEHLDQRRFSVDSSLVRRRFSPTGLLGSSATSSPLVPYHSTRASLPDHGVYASSIRQMTSPIPGPLPAPGFSFGAATSHVHEGDGSSPESGGLLPPGDGDSEEDMSYGAYRFGSMASVATSESSTTSAYYSDVGSLPDLGDYNPNDRRGSSASCIGMMSGLAVNGSSSAEKSPYPQSAMSSVSHDGVPHVSAGPNVFAQPQPQNASHTSELAHALHPEEGLTNFTGQPPAVDGIVANDVVSTEQRPELGGAQSAPPGQQQDMHPYNDHTAYYALHGFPTTPTNGFPPTPSNGQSIAMPYKMEYEYNDADPAAQGSYVHSYAQFDGAYDGPPANMGFAPYGDHQFAYGSNNAHSYATPAYTSCS